MDNSAKSWYLNDDSYPIDDPVVRDWLAGTFAVTPQLAQHLASLTHGDADWWLAKDASLLARGGRILPAMPIYEVRILQPYEDSYISTRHLDKKEAEKDIQQFVSEKERDIADGDYDDGRFATLSRAALFLPNPSSQS